MPTELFLEDALVVILGLACGSFLNVLALRSLSEESLFWPPSRCPSCKQSICWYDNIPVLSFIVLKGKCRHCQAKISWQYPLVELLTAVSYLVLVLSFGYTWQTLAMIVFVSTLIAITVTDFREKLIPHDITYPSMLLGIAFSHFVRGDLLGTMAGIGASYILFDFIAHYGLKFYLYMHRNDPPLAEEKEQEQVEVMGGGDAVLSAVIASWLGWQKLVVALVIGFCVGMVMGVVYLGIEMKKQGIISQTIRPMLLGSSSGMIFVVSMAAGFRALAGLVPTDIPWLSLAAIGGILGALLGFIFVGSRVSKPFPFGPALAIGAVSAIFIDAYSMFPLGSR